LAHEKKKKVLRLWTLILGISLRTHLELREHLAKHIGMAIGMAHHKRKFWDCGHYYWEYLEELIWNSGERAVNTLGLEGNLVRTHWEHQKPEKLQSPGRTLFPKPIKNLLTPSEWGSSRSKHPPDSTSSEQAAFFWNSLLLRRYATLKVHLDFQLEITGMTLYNWRFSSGF
jgi:hypothetical protein